MKEEINIFGLANKIKRIIKSESILVRGPITKGSPTRKGTGYDKNQYENQNKLFYKIR